MQGSTQLPRETCRPQRERSTRPLVSPVCTSPYTALTGQPVGQLRGGPARAFDVESTLSCFRYRFIYLIYGYGSRGAVTGGPQKRHGGYLRP